jgi:hypothetical protein
LDLGLGAGGAGTTATRRSRPGRFSTSAANAPGVPSVTGRKGGGGTFGAATEVVDVAVDALVAIDIDTEEKGGRDSCARALRRRSCAPMGDRLA